MNTGVRVTYGQRNIETKHIECTSSIVFCLINFFSFIGQCIKKFNKSRSVE